MESYILQVKQKLKIILSVAYMTVINIHMMQRFQSVLGFASSLHQIPFLVKNVHKTTLSRFVKKQTKNVTKNQSVLHVKRKVLFLLANVTKEPLVSFYFLNVIILHILRTLNCRSAQNEMREQIKQIPFQPVSLLRTKHGTAVSE